jgi:protease-4
MKDFLKFTFASCLGVLLATVVFGIFFSLIIGAVISSSSSGAETKTNIKSNSILALQLNKVMPELTNNTEDKTFDFEHPDVLGLHDILDMIEHAKDDENIKGIYIDGDQIVTGLSSSTLIRDALTNFKASGKPVVAHANNYGQMPYYLASTADEVFLSPTGNLDFRGFGAINPFIKGSLDKLGINMQVFYAGDYKSATEIFRRTDMSDANREQTRAFLNDFYGQFLVDIAENRELTVSSLKAAANDLSTSQPEIAKNLGLIDELGYRIDALDYLKQQIGLESEDKMYLVDPEDYYLSYTEERKGSSKQRIAVVYAEGEIRDGEDQPGLITGDKYVSLLRKLRKDEKVKAVVLRVNSPGGSVISSDDIWHEVERIQEAGKPVIVSMGDLAASGGYYISCGSDKIFSQPNTITGSIGVFMIMANTRELMEDKLGMSFDTVSTGKHSTRMNSIYAPNEEESAALQASVDRYYQTFLQRVAEGRKMSIEEVHEVAQGRIWTGTKAKELGLVDEIGDVNDAIAEAAKMAELDDYRIYEYPTVKNQWQQLLEQFSNTDKSAKALLDDKISSVVPYYDFYNACLENNHIPQARLPVIVEY